jgi:hypothetical protein
MFSRLCCGNSANPALCRGSLDRRVPSTLGKGYATFETRAVSIEDMNRSKSRMGRMR